MVKSKSKLLGPYHLLQLARGVRSLVGVVFSWIYHRTNRNHFFHNSNQCTAPRDSFLTYIGVVFCDRFNQFKILNFFFFLIRLSSPISIHQPVQDLKQIQTFIYLASCQSLWTGSNSSYFASMSNCPYIIHKWIKTCSYING